MGVKKDLVRVVEGPANIPTDTEGEYLKKISRSVQDSFLPNDRFDHRLIAAFLKCHAGGTPVCTLRQA